MRIRLYIKQYILVDIGSIKKHKLQFLICVMYQQLAECQKMSTQRQQVTSKSMKVSDVTTGT